MRHSFKFKSTVNHPLTGAGVHIQHVHLEINIVLITVTSSTFKIWKLSAVIRISITVGQQTTAGFGVQGCCYAITFCSAAAFSKEVPVPGTSICCHHLISYLE